MAAVRVTAKRNRIEILIRTIERRRRDAIILIYSYQTKHINKVMELIKKKESTKII